MSKIYCNSCRYDLAGLQSNRCPECGRAFDPHDPRSFRSTRALRPRDIPKWLIVSALGRALVAAIMVTIAGIAVWDVIELRLRIRGYERQLVSAAPDASGTLDITIVGHVVGDEELLQSSRARTMLFDVLRDRKGPLDVRINLVGELAQARYEGLDLVLIDLYDPALGYNENSWFLGALRFFPGTGTTEHLLAVLRTESDSRLRRAAAYALGSVTTSNALLDIRTLFDQEHDIHVKIGLAFAIRRCGDISCDQWLRDTAAK